VAGCDAKRQLKLMQNSNPQTDYDIIKKRLAHQILLIDIEQETKAFFFEQLLLNNVLT
jgi:hypothetical protein